MRKILKIASAILLGVILIMNTGCARKGSRAWIEDQTADLEKVYPTENAEDLFEKFPNGFIISQSKVFKENGELYKINLDMKGNEVTRKITGKIKKVRVETGPYKEIVEKESEVEYKKGQNLVLAKPELREELLPRNYFLFQKKELNKDIFNPLEVENKVYTSATERYSIKYRINNNEINNYLDLNNDKVILDVSGHYSEKDKTYFHTILIKGESKKFDFFEKVVEEKEDKKGDTE